MFTRKFLKRNKKVPKQVPKRVPKTGLRPRGRVHSAGFPREVEGDLRYTSIILFTKSIPASSGSRFEIHNDNFIHKILGIFPREVEADLRYTTIILLTKSIVASSGSRFEVLCVTSVSPILSCIHLPKRNHLCERKKQGLSASKTLLCELRVIE